MHYFYEIFAVATPSVIEPQIIGVWARCWSLRCEIRAPQIARILWLESQENMYQSPA